MIEKLLVANQIKQSVCFFNKIKEIDCSIIQVFGHAALTPFNPVIRIFHIF